MGVPLTSIIVKETPTLAQLARRRVAVDGHGELYQFLALIRSADGIPLQHEGRVTSHLVGLFYRTTRLLSEHGVEPAFVFDGRPPELKAGEIGRRRETRARFEAEAAEARAAGDLARAYSKSTMSARLTAAMIDEARELLRLLGLPVVQAPGEGEAQAAFMAARGDVWAAASKDYDSLLFGAPRLLRFLAIRGREFLPSKGAFRAVPPELITAEGLLAHLAITREQLVDLAILVGTDFNDGIAGVGPKRALALVQKYGRIESMPGDVRNQVAEFAAVRDVFLRPPVSTDYALAFGEPDEPGLLRFLCDERGFSRQRVAAALERLRRQPLLPL
jgi:flap endonuclease-1